MKNKPSITILTGGVGPEREISLLTGKALLHFLKNSFDVSITELNNESLPNFNNLDNTVVFPAIHGTFGEDGRLQEMLENIGLNYAGSDANSSRLCMNKYDSKKVVHASGVRIAPDLRFNQPQKLDINEVLGKIGPNAIIKPVDQGSSVGLHVIKGEMNYSRFLMN
jgi:D-alanine-D-alanine ligase